MEALPAARVAFVSLLLLDSTSFPFSVPQGVMGQMPVRWYVCTSRAGESRAVGVGVLKRKLAMASKTCCLPKSVEGSPICVPGPLLFPFHIQFS